MGKAVRRRAAAGFAVLGAGVIAVTPVGPPTPHDLHVANLEIALTASVANIPINLVYALANIPYNGVQAVNQGARSLFHTGTWWVASASNIWGTDIADPGHWESVISVLVPFPAMSSVLGRQVAMLMAAEFPTSGSCDAEGCSPIIPVDPITGITQLDATIQVVAALTGIRPLPLVDNWFKVPLSVLLSGYTFPEKVTSPSGPAYAGFGFPGTHPDPVTGQPLLPWSGQTFRWDPLEPLVAFYQSLTATPAPLADAIKIPTVEQIVRASQAILAASVVDFYPFVPGSPSWLNEFDVPRALSTRTIVKLIGKLYPGNAMIDEWLAADQNGTANGPTDAQVAWSKAALQPAVFTLRPETLAEVNKVLAGIHPVLPDIAAHSGLLGNRNLVKLFTDIERLIDGGGAGGSGPVGSAGATVAAQPDAAGEPAMPLAETGRSGKTRVAELGSDTISSVQNPAPATSVVRPSPRASATVDQSADTTDAPAAQARTHPSTASGSDPSHPGASTGDREGGTPTQGKGRSARADAGLRQRAS